MNNVNEHYSSIDKLAKGRCLNCFRTYRDPKTIKNCNKIVMKLCPYCGSKNIKQRQL